MATVGLLLRVCLVVTVVPFAVAVLQRYGDDRRFNLIPLGMPMHHAPTNSSAVRAELIKQTRPDLGRQICIKMGAIAGRGLKACDGKTSDP